MRGGAAFRIVRTLVATAFAVTTAREASAATRLDPEFVAMLAHRGSRRHPLADGAGRLPLVVEVPPGADPRERGFLPLASGLAAVRVAPRDLLRFTAEHPGARFSIWPGLRPVLDLSTRRSGVLDYRAELAAQGAPISGTGQGVVVGIIDTGIDAFHPDFRDPTGASRIAWMLDFARVPTGRHIALEARYGCSEAGQSSCAIFDRSDIDRAIANGGEGGLTPDPVGHGTHVASIAAGNGGSDPRFAGVAPQSVLVIASVAGASGAVTVADIDVVNAARFIFDRAEEMGMPAVVNVSLGSDFGPHDGTSPLEIGLAELVGEAHPGRAMVLAAGNSGAQYQGEEAEQVFGIHTETRVTGAAPAKLRLMTPDAKKGATIGGSVFVWVTYGATDSIAIGLEGPKGLSIKRATKGSRAGFQASDDTLSAAIYNGVVGGESPLPSDSHGAILVWDGQWPGASEFTLNLEGEGLVNAWVEANFDDASLAGPIYFDRSTRAGTISVPATHPDLIAVGCVNNRSAWTDGDGVSNDLATTPYAVIGQIDGNCYFSAAGPSATGVAKPEISAPGSLIAAAMSRDALPGSSPFSAFAAPSGFCAAGNECLVVDSGHALLSGTSMSSPHVAGAIALLFERDSRLAQREILRLLQGGARRPDALLNSEFQLGIGALDMKGAASAEASRASPIVREPSAFASWLSLSSPYLRPGDGPRLIGTVAMRAADGALADGFDPARLRLEIGDEGVVDAPLTREGAGLYRFAIRARADTGGRVLALDVTLDGTPLGQAGSRLSGHRIVSIGADRWIAVGSTRVYGGCGVARWAPAGDAAPARAFFTSCLAAGGLAIRRCRRRIPKAVRSTR
jgi:subtilisin family serine protease